MRHIDERGYNHYRARTTRITVAFSVVCPNNHAITRKRITYITVKYICCTYQPTRSTNDVGRVQSAKGLNSKRIYNNSHTHVRCVLLHYIHIMIILL